MIAEPMSEGLADFETALADPAAYYADPQAILADTELTTGQKHRFLTEWVQDLTDRLQADQEGMASETPGVGAADADLLRRVLAALDQLDGNANSAGDAPTKSFWKRLVPL